MRRLAKGRIDFVMGKPPQVFEFADDLEAGGIDPASLGLRAVILSGGPDNTAAQRHALQERFAARCLNRYGMTEAGTIAAECIEDEGVLQLVPGAFVVELHNDHASFQGDASAATGELVLTTLGRTASPLVRYRTGDRVQLKGGNDQGRGGRGLAIVGDVARTVPSSKTG